MVSQEDPGTGSLLIPGNGNAVVIIMNIINYTCAFPAMTCQNIRCEKGLLIFLNIYHDINIAVYNYCTYTVVLPHYRKSDLFQSSDIRRRFTYLKVAQTVRVCKRKADVHWRCKVLKG